MKSRMQKKKNSLVECYERNRHAVSSASLLHGGGEAGGEGQSTQLPDAGRLGCKELQRAPCLYICGEVIGVVTHSHRAYEEQPWQIPLALLIGLIDLLCFRQ